MLLFGCKPVFGIGLLPAPRMLQLPARRTDPAHIFVLQPDPSASEIAFVDVLPEADRDFANALDVSRAHGAVGVEIGTGAAVVVK